MANIFKTIEFNNDKDDKCDVLIPTVRDFSIIFQQQAEYNAKAIRENPPIETLDNIPFFLKRLCRFNGEEKSLDFILKLKAHVYLKISPVIEEMMVEAQKGNI